MQPYCPFNAWVFSAVLRTVFAQKIPIRKNPVLENQEAGKDTQAITRCGNDAPRVLSKLELWDKPHRIGQTTQVPLPGPRRSLNLLAGSLPEYHNRKSPLEEPPPCLARVTLSISSSAAFLPAPYRLAGRNSTHSSRHSYSNVSPSSTRMAMESFQIRNREHC